MATDEVLLLEEEEIENERELLEDVQPFLTGDGLKKRESVQSDLIDVQETRRSRRQHVLAKELIISVFVVAFDTKKGNIVEWSYPDEVNLDGVEFRAMASGFHNVDSDFIYFKHNQLFGLCVYEKLSVDNIEERGARMRSVGLLAVSYSNLHTHMTFLQQQAKLRVETPTSDYNSLIQYFWNMQAPRPPPISPASLATADLPHMEITHPEGCFSQFLQVFGARVFVLWKLALLKKRIIICSPPPVGVLCYRVYSACLLASHNMDNLELDTDSNPMFFVNVADIDTLSTLGHYIACTTESIFQNKTHLYDVFVDNENINITSERLRPFLKVTPADEQRYNRLTGSQNMALSVTKSMKYKSEEDAAFARFFQHINTELYQMLLEVSMSSEDHVMTCEMIDAIGLDVKDSIFLTELASLHRLNVTVQRPSDVFSCCI